MRRWSAAVVAALGFVAGAPAAAETAEAAPPDATAHRLLALIERVSTNLRESRYTHATRVDERKGRYEFDCSGMAAWLLRRTATKAHGAVMWRSKKGRPLARDYYHQIASTRPGSPRFGWERVPRVADARAGDVIAWLKPNQLRSPNTGHVAFLVEPPIRVPEHEHAFLLRVADASRYQHENRTGFGVGNILVLADPSSGAPMAYGWVGMRSRWVFATRMAIGRVLE